MKAKTTLLLLIFFIFNSCNKDSISENENVDYRIDSSIIEGVYSTKIENGGVTSDKNNILVFESIEKYLEVIQTLSSLNLDYNNSKPQNLNAENDWVLVDNNNFIEDVPLINFEKELNFVSLRHSIKEKEKVWLRDLSFDNENDFNFDQDPDSHSILDEAERSILNDEGEVIIGTNEEDFKILKFMRNGSVYEFEYSDLNTLQEFNQNESANSEGINEQRLSCKTSASYEELYNVPGSSIWIKGNGSLKNKKLSFFSNKRVSTATSRTRLYIKIGGNLYSASPGSGWIEAKLNGDYKQYTCSSSSLYKSINQLSSSSSVSVSFSAISSGGNLGILVSNVHSFPRVALSGIHGLIQSNGNYTFQDGEEIW